MGAVQNGCVCLGGMGPAATLHPSLFLALFVHERFQIMGRSREKIVCLFEGKQNVRRVLRTRELKMPMTIKILLYGP